jgi:hypothetical protein
MIPRSEILKNPTTGSCEKSTEKAFIATSSGKYRLEDDRGTFITMLITLLLRLLCTLMTKSRTAPYEKESNTQKGNQYG